MCRDNNAHVLSPFSKSRVLLAQRLRSVPAPCREVSRHYPGEFPVSPCQGAIAQRLHSEASNAVASALAPQEVSPSRSGAASSARCGAEEQRRSAEAYFPPKPKPIRRSLRTPRKSAECESRGDQLEAAPPASLAAVKVWKDFFGLSDLEMRGVSTSRGQEQQANYRCTISPCGREETPGPAPLARIEAAPTARSDRTGSGSDEARASEETAPGSGGGGACDCVPPSVPLCLERQLQEYRRLAYRTRDLPMLAKFLELARAPGACEADRELLVMQIRAVRMLHLCNYASEDICLILAHASAYAGAYFRDVSVARRGSPLRPTEVAYMLLIFMYMAHAWIMDRNCELSEWHDYLFDDWCTIGQLNIVVLRLLMLRGGIMRLGDEDMKQRWKALLQARKGNKMEGNVQLLASWP